jgi:PEP-CTERM motif
MKLSYFHAAVIFGLAAGAAHASVSTAVAITGTSNQVGLGGIQTFNANPLEADRLFSRLNGSATQSGGDITFADGVTVAGPGANSMGGRGSLISGTTMADIVQVITNDTTAAVDVKLSSVLFAGAFGMFVAEPDSCGNPSPGSCQPDLSRSQPLAAIGDAHSGFNVDVKVNDTSIYSLSASLSLSGGVFTSDVAAASSSLSGFTGGQLNSGSSVFQKFYSWNNTPLILDLGQLGVGQSLTLSYQLSTYSDSTLGGDGGDVIFSAFGDPIGHGGVINLTEPIMIDPITAPAPIVAFTPVAVPEPATWALLIMGIGMIGTSLRRRLELNARPVAAA